MAALACTWKVVGVLSSRRLRVRRARSTSARRACLLWRGPARAVTAAFSCEWGDLKYFLVGVTVTLYLWLKQGDIECVFLQHSLEVFVGVGARLVHDSLRRPSLAERRSSAKLFILRYFELHGQLQFKLEVYLDGRGYCTTDGLL